MVECTICNDRELILQKQNSDWVAIPCQCREQKALRRMFKASGLSSEQLRVKLKHYKPTVETISMFRVVKNYLENFPEILRSSNQNKGIALTGTVGIGKTMLATAIANELLNRRIPTVFVNTPDLMADLRASQFSDDAYGLEKKINKLKTVQVCIFDDVAKEKATDWVKTQYFRIVDYRCNNKLPTIFTSNFDFDGIEERLGDAVSSRLYALTRDRQVYVDAADYRIKAVK